jgi:hypothetical protein
MQSPKSYTNGNSMHVSLLEIVIIPSQAHKQKGRREAGLFFKKLVSRTDQYLATTGPPKV